LHVFSVRYGKPKEIANVPLLRTKTIFNGSSITALVLSNSKWCQTSHSPHRSVLHLRVGPITELSAGLKTLLSLMHTTKTCNIIFFRETLFFGCVRSRVSHNDSNTIGTIRVGDPPPNPET